MISDVDKERYNRQIILKGFGVTAQEKLLAAKVLVIGAGGLGCPALQYLAAAGVGTIGIVDADVVSLSNLHRQVLYAQHDIGLYKVAVAAKKIASLNPGITVNIYQENFQNSNALHIISAYDWVLDGTDNFPSRYLINDACVLLGKPLVYGAVSQFQGQVAVFNVVDKDGVTTNYRDVFPNPPKKGEVPNCAAAGVLGVLPGIIGTMQAAEVIKLITAIGLPLVNRLLTYNVLTNQFYEIGLTPSLAKSNLQPSNKEAFLQMNYNSFCGMEDRKIIEIDAAQFEVLRKQPSTIVVDVRETGELPLVTTIEHQHIPMTVFNEGMKNITAQQVILFCQHGIRSMYAGEMMLQQFGNTKELYSLKGGISRWADQLL